MPNPPSTVRRAEERQAPGDGQPQQTSARRIRMQNPQPRRRSRSFPCVLIHVVFSVECGTSGSCDGVAGGSKHGHCRRRGRACGREDAGAPRPSSEMSQQHAAQNMTMGAVQYTRYDGYGHGAARHKATEVHPFKHVWCKDVWQGVARGGDEYACTPHGRPWASGDRCCSITHRSLRRTPALHRRRQTWWRPPPERRRGAQSIPSSAHERSRGSRNRCCSTAPG